MGYCHVFISYVLRRTQINFILVVINKTCGFFSCSVHTYGLLTFTIKVNEIHLFGKDKYTIS